jgi:hypothetical protein
MSMLLVLETVLAACQDPTIGLASQVATLVTAGAPPVRADFAFGKWTVKQALRDARTPSITVSPATGADEIAAKQVGHADGVQDVEIALEYFDADPAKRQDAIAVIQAALVMVLCELVDFAQATGGTIYEVVSPAVTTYGEFGSPASATGAGFVSRITFMERARS